jgi:threonine/homoserine/homoserine lactone efflux protein
VLSQALKPGLAATDVALLWTLLVAESLLWFALVALLFSSRPVLAWLRARLVWLDRTVGAVLLVLAAKVSVLAVR